MRFEDGRWVCTWCGATLDIPIDKRLVETLHGAGGVPNRRVITVDGRPVHECEQPAQLLTSSLRHAHDEDGAGHGAALDER